MANTPITCGPSGSTTAEVFAAVNASQVKGWEATASSMTAKSYAIEPEDVPVKVWTSNGDGTYSSVDTSDFSALHWDAKAGAIDVQGAIDAGAAAKVSENEAEKSEWNAEAWERTSKSYAVEPEDVFVKLWSSDGAGGFTSVDTADYSSLHWEAKTHFIATANKGHFFKPDSDKALFVKSSPDSFTVPADTEIKVDATLVQIASDVPLSLASDLDTGTKTPGTDYYIYAKADSTFYISVDKTKTDGRLIGGFHYGLVDETEAPTGNKTEADMVKIRGINEFSLWDLKFRPICEPEGMAYILGRWYDIYLLNSEHVANGTSKAGLVIAAGATDSGRAIPKIPLAFGGDGSTNYGAFKWFHATEVGKSHSKELISYEQFMAIAYGVVEKTDSSIVGETVIGKIEHYPQLTSKFGIEQATGVQYIWGSDIGNSTSGTWNNVLDGRGDIYSDIKTVLLGGGRGNGSNAGSRCSYWSNSLTYSNWGLGCRFSCDSLKLL